MQALKTKLIRTQLSGRITSREKVISKDAHTRGCAERIFLYLDIFLDVMASLELCEMRSHTCQAATECLK